jgi:hypothetical protein
MRGLHASSFVGRGAREGRGSSATCSTSRPASWASSKTRTVLRLTPSARAIARRVEPRFASATM